MIMICKFFIVPRLLKRRPPPKYYALYDKQTCRLMATGLNTRSKKELADAYLSYISSDVDEEVLALYRSYTTEEVLREATENEFSVFIEKEPFNVDY